MNPQRTEAAVPLPARPPSARRAQWLKTLHQWHWISAAVSLLGMLMFSITGFTLNHAAQIEGRPEVVRRQGVLPERLRAELTDARRGNAALPAALRDWLVAEWSLQTGEREAEWSADEVYLSLPRPGGDAWLRIDRASGELEYERTDRGWISYFNDLHKGRHSGRAWSGFIDVFALACVVFTLTGLFILQMQAAKRPSTWPLVGLGLVIPALLALLFIH